MHYVIVIILLVIILYYINYKASAPVATPAPSPTPVPSPTPECTKNSDCSTDYCDQTTGLCGLINDNTTPCSSGTQCYTNYCEQNKCQLIPTNDTTMCRSNSQCADGYCDTSQGMCSLYPYGHDCTLNSDCASEYCVNQKCGLILTNSTVTCTSSEQCESQLCELSKCQVIPTNNTSIMCQFNPQCASNYCDTASGICRLFPTGYKCTSNSDCATDYCNQTSGLCGLINDNTTPCTTNTQCSTNYCDSDTKLCATLFENGAQCTADTQCLSNYCNTTCSGNTELLLPCTSNSQCISNFCDPNLKYCSTNVTKCSHDSDCAAGHCNNGLCSGTKKGATGDSCTNAFDCLSFSCTGGKCDMIQSYQSTGQQCDPTQGLTACDSSADLCLELIFTSGEYFCRSHSTYIRVPDTVMDGALCQDNFTMSDNSCFYQSGNDCMNGQIYLNNICYIPKSVGDFCQRDDECVTGNCISNKCRPKNLLTENTGTCNPISGPFCPDGYYCNKNECVVVDGVNCDLGGTSSCYCDPLSLKCYIPSGFAVNPHFGTQSYYTSTTLNPGDPQVFNYNTDRSYILTGDDTAETISDALILCQSDAGCVGVMVAQNGDMSLIKATDVTTAVVPANTKYTFYPSKFM